jgi:hypothetical protein
MSLGIEFHLNTCFKHFIYYTDEYKLIEEKELAPLSELIAEFRDRKKQKEAESQSSERVETAINTNNTQSTEAN